MKIIYLFLVIILWINVANAQPRKQNASTKTAQASNQVAEAPQIVGPIQTQPNSSAESEAYRKERDAKDDTFRTKQTEQNEVIKDATKWIAGITGLNLLLAIVFAIFGGLQWRAMREGLEHSQRMFHVSERAYMGLDEMGAFTPLTVGQHPAVRMLFHNSGRTPADNFRVRTRTTFGPPDMSSEELICLNPLDPDHRPGHSVRGGASRTVDVPPGVNPGMTEKAIEALIDYQLCLYVIGDARYKDFMGKEWPLPFVTIYDPNDGENGSFMHCDS